MKEQYKKKRGKLIYVLCGFQSRPVSLSGRQVILHRMEEGNNYKIVDVDEFKDKWKLVDGFKSY